MRNYLSKIYLSLCLIACIFSFSNCGGVNYTFSGADIGTATTISINYFANKAPLNAPQLSQIFTEKLKTKFIRETSLKLVEDNGDMQLTGYISDYRITPVAIQNNTTAAQNRLTISINVTFKNTTNDKTNFDETISNFADFDATTNLSTVETALINEISDKIVQEIFNKAVINW